MMYQDKTPLLSAMGAENGDNSDSQKWMVTLADLIALLVTFFVLLFSMMKLEQEKWNNLTNSLFPEMKQSIVATELRPVFSMDLPRLKTVPGKDLDYLIALLSSHLENTKDLKGAALYAQEDRLILSLPGRLLFEIGQVEPRKEAVVAIQDMSGLLSNLSNRLEVAGHADPTPVVSAWPSNRELSLARAEVVARLLRQAGYARDIPVRGYGDAHFEFLDSSLPESVRLNLARRTDIIIFGSTGEEAPAAGVLPEVKGQQSDGQGAGAQ